MSQLESRLEKHQNLLRRVSGISEERDNWGEWKGLLPRSLPTPREHLLQIVRDNAPTERWKGIATREELHDWLTGVTQKEQSILGHASAALQSGVTYEGRLHNAPAVLILPRMMRVHSAILDFVKRELKPESD